MNILMQFFIEKKTENNKQANNFEFLNNHWTYSDLNHQFVIIILTAFRLYNIYKHLSDGLRSIFEIILKKLKKKLVLAMN